MTLSLPFRTVMPVGTRPSCTARVSADLAITVRVSAVACSIKNPTINVAQKADKTITLQGGSNEDWSAASDIVFRVWTGVVGGTQLISKTMTGADITMVSDYSASFDLSNTDTAISAGVHHWEAWLEFTGPEQVILGRGRFEVVDTRNYD